MPAPQPQQLALNGVEAGLATAAPAPDGVGIDTAFPVDIVNALAGIETFNKHLFRPNTYLHKWWARRSGTTFRAILKQLADDPGRRDYYAVGGLEHKVILDPMLGGGTTVHEAIRLGAHVIGSDIDPIPVLQARASLTRLPLAEKAAVFQAFFAQLAARLGPLSETACPACQARAETQFMLYGVKKACACRAVVMVDSLALRDETDGSVVRLASDSGEVYISATPRDAVGNPIIYAKSVRVCPHCGQPFAERKDVPYWQRYAPLVVAGQCPVHGQFFKAVDTDDKSRLAAAETIYLSRPWLPFDALGVPRGPKSGDLLARGVANYADLFTPRQALYLAHAHELLQAVEPAHREWLALLVSTSLEFNALLCGYKGSDKRRPGAIRHVFSHHAYSFPYTALENNPVFSGNTSGTLGRLYRNRIEAAARWADAPIERRYVNGAWQKVTLRGEVDGGQRVASLDELQATPNSFLVMQQDSSRLPLPGASVDHVVTDPPYFDSVQYSDLADFFRVWLRWFLPDAARWDYDVSASAVAETDKAGAKYQAVLGAIWREAYRVLKRPNGRLIFTFHHWRPDAWIHLTLALKHADFRLVTTYTVHSENPISVHIRQLNALKHDSILVLAPKAGATTSAWPPLDRITTSDSHTFCADCARLLGYCLDTDLTDDEIAQVWQLRLPRPPRDSPRRRGDGGERGSDLENQAWKPIAHSPASGAMTRARAGAARSTRIATCARRRRPRRARSASTPRASPPLRSWAPSFRGLGSCRTWPRRWPCSGMGDSRPSRSSRCSLSTAGAPSTSSSSTTAPPRVTTSSTASSPSVAAACRVRSAPSSSTPSRATSASIAPRVATRVASPWRTWFRAGRYAWSAVSCRRRW